MMRVRIYAGPGALPVCQRHTIAMLEDALTLPVSPIEPRELLEGDWESDTTLLVLPGGADIPYTKVLNGKGNQRIRSFVEEGGAFLGICAGSYNLIQTPNKVNWGFVLNFERGPF